MAESRLVRLVREQPLVVTGMGAFSAGGANAEELWNAAVAGKGTARGLELEGRRWPACLAPEVDLSREEFRRLQRLDRAVQIGCVAGEEALQQSRCRNAYPSDRIGIIVGTARGPLGNIYAASNQPPRPSTVADNSVTSVSGALARSFGFRGPCFAVAATCASAAVAIAQGAEQILLGKADAVLVGGTEAPLQRRAFEDYEAAGVLARHDEPAQACRPFDVDRSGLVLGEGSAFLVLETLEGARARGAVPLARLIGWAYGCDVSSRTASAGDGVVQVIEAALNTAELAASEIDYLNLHGTGTPLGDFTEAEIMGRVFGEKATVPCSSTKPVTGHCLGGTPALEAVLAVQALERQTIPPSANCPNQDPCCQINLVKGSAEGAQLRTVMSNSLGFWGQCASLIFAKSE